MIRLCLMVALWVCVMALPHNARAEGDCGPECQKLLTLTIQEVEALADKDDVEAQITMGFSYQYGANGVEKSDEKALHWYTRAASLDNANAQFELATAYRNKGLGLDAFDIIKAIYWYDRAAKNGHIEAQAQLIALYSGETDEDIVPDALRAMDLTLDAAKRNPFMYLHAARLLFRGGYGLEKDDAKAMEYIKRSGITPAEFKAIMADEYPICLKYARHSRHDVCKAMEQMANPDWAKPSSQPPLKGTPAESDPK